MPPLLSLLLETPAVLPASSAAIAGIVLSAVALIFSFWAFTRKESREDGQTVNQRLKKMELGFANQEARQAGFQTEIEGVADHAERERRVMAENAKRDIDSLKDQIKDVPSMRDLLNRMDERFISTNDAVKNLDRKMDSIVSLLTHK